MTFVDARMFIVRFRLDKNIFVEFSVTLPLEYPKSINITKPAFLGTRKNMTEWFLLLFNIFIPQLISITDTLTSVHSSLETVIFFIGKWIGAKKRYTNHLSAYEN
jgi:hypothetical protein